ncbi:glycosyltransferase family 4 protein [Sphaerisporangium aureirubrum]|uniref:Glycosyltransferase family 4 protein n=1 Tax=Sphaerisporangium aureirubrum TaxID=1544736 RepID=A0ABW1NIZ9_9ACTN
MKIRYLLLHAYGMGGTIRTVVSQANAMAALGHDVEIVSVVRRRAKPQFEIDPRVRVRALNDQRKAVPSDSLGRRAWRRVRGKVVPPGEFAARYFTEVVERAVMEYVSTLEDGVLVTTRPALNLISARRATAGVIRVGQEHMNLGTYPKRVRSAIIRHYAGLDAVVTLTESDQAEYQKALPGAPIVHIPNAVSATGREPSRQENPVVIAAGRLVTQKGFDLLIPAFRRVADVNPGWELRIFGSGPKEESLTELIKEHDLAGHVKLMGRTQSLPGELTGASIYVLSSRFEGLPMVMIEAMNHALPVAAFDCPTGPADVLTHERNGLLVPPGDIDALAAALNRLIADRDLRVRLGTAARTRARDYTPEVVMPRWESLFQGLAETRR